jgi:2-polyprenyl-6-methoxyphenol hydroxylase-like FAD-dependent oxidoreductase
VLLARGQAALEDLFPALRAELIAAGAAPIDVADEIAYLTPAGWSPRFRSGISIVPCSRDLLEACLRRRVRTNAHVDIREGRQAVGLLAGRGGAIVGVKARDAAGRDDAGEEMAADLVVDATGRGSRLARWLQELGHPVPAARIVDPQVRYTSRLYEGPARLPDGWRGAFIQSAPPSSTRGGALLPIEGGRALLTLIGRGDDLPPTDDEGFLAFARSLRSPMIHDAVAQMRPLTRPASSRTTDNRRHLYNTMRTWPDGLVAVGDAVCAFNPIYGQGMTTAALGAAVLRGDVTGRGGRVPVQGRRFQRRLARIHAPSWMFDTDLDLLAGGGDRPRPGLTVHVRQAYLRHVGQIAVERPEVRRAFLEVFHLLKTRRSLLRPSIAMAVAAHATRQHLDGRRIERTA